MKKYIILILSSILILSTSCYAKEPQIPAIYKKAKNELGSYHYQVYRITEQLIKANQLDNHTWRINLAGLDGNNATYDFKAETSEANLITIYPGMLDTFSGDLSAFAFIISHELAHQLLEHTKKREYIRENFNRKIIETKNLEKKGKEIERKFKYSDYHGLGSIVKYIDDDKELDNINQKIQTFNDREPQRRQSFFASIQRHEYEADDLGLLLMVRAGFDPNGVLRAIAFLKRLATTYDPEGSHPPIENRLYALQNRLRTLGIKKLKTEGKQNTEKSQILSCDYSLDGKSIKINSKYSNGNNIDQALDNLFDKK